MKINNEANTVRTLFSIQTKEGVKVPFVFNEAQMRLDRIDNPYGRVRILIAKARQLGFSSVVLSKFSLRCLGNEGRHCVVMSHEADATQRLLDRSHFFLKHLRGPQPITGRNSRNELYFPKTESTYFVGTAGSRAFGRGDFITDLHCSEYAWWQDPVKHATGMFQAVPYNGRIYIESTGNGRNNDFYYMWVNAEQMGYQRLFHPWWAGNEYELPIECEWRPDLPQHTPYMLDIQSKFKLNSRKMLWYESKLKELREDLRMMQQEYPSEPEECFQATGGTIFQNVHLSTSPLWVARSILGYHAFVLDGHPQQDFNYVVGADPSGGTGNDDAGLEVFCVETGEQVFEWSYNTVDPITYAKYLIEIGKMHNTAYISCEGNNHGAAIIPYLKTHYPHDRLFKSKIATRITPSRFGWFNTQLTKHVMVGLMQEYMDQVTLYGVRTVKELKAFEETPEGQLGGKSDNLVIATGLAMMGLRRFQHLRQDYLTPKVTVKREKPNYMSYSLDEVLANIEQRRRYNADMFGRQVDLEPVHWQ